MLSSAVPLVGVVGLLVLGGNMVVAQGDADRLRRARVSFFVGFALFCWALAADMLLSPDRMGAATASDAEKTALFFSVGGLLMVGFAGLIHRRRM